MNKLVKLDINLDNAMYNNSLKVLNFTIKKFDDVLMEVGFTSSDPLFELPTQEIVIYGLRSDKERLKQTDNIQINEGKLYVKLSNAFTCVSGLCKLEFELVDLEGQVTSCALTYHVEDIINNGDAFEVVTVEQLKGSNDVAKENITELNSLNSIAFDKIRDLTQLLEDSIAKVQDLQSSVELAAKTNSDLVAKFEEVKEWSKDFDYDSAIPQIKEDVEYLKNKPTTVTIY